MNCRHCQSLINSVVLDLGYSPPSNSFLSKDDLSKQEVYLPLRVFVCEVCWLVQTADYVASTDLFSSTYVYFSSTSSSWMIHIAKYVEMVVGRFGLSEDSQVIEIASNDGYLLKDFVRRGIPSLGIEPTDSTADEADRQGVKTMRRFFTKDLATELIADNIKADLIIGNNVYAHVPDINDFTAGIATLLKKDGVVTLEFPHLLELIRNNQFDTVYHEHFSYLSLITVCQIFESQGLKVFDVEKIQTHGGSLRVYGCQFDSVHLNDTNAVEKIIAEELEMNLNSADGFEWIQGRAEATKFEFLTYLIKQKDKQKRVIGYGAAAKGNTLLNYAGVKSDLIEYVVDGALSKQNKFLPGSHIPVKAPWELDIVSGESLFIFPWNISSEVKAIIENRFSDLPKILVAIPRVTEI